VKSCLVWLLVGLVSQFGLAADSVRAKQIDSIFADLKSDDSPGTAVVVLKNGRAEFMQGYGVTDLLTRSKIDAHTNFRLASLTKQFTAMAIMLLVHDGKLRYEDHLTDLFPDFPDYGRTITVRNLLNHTSGLQDYEDLMAKPDSNTPLESIPQIKDAGVLQLLKQQKGHQICSGHEVGLQQFRLCCPRHHRGESFGHGFC